MFKIIYFNDLNIKTNKQLKKKKKKKKQKQKQKQKSIY